MLSQIESKGFDQSLAEKRINVALAAIGDVAFGEIEKNTSRLIYSEEEFSIIISLKFTDNETIATCALVDNSWTKKLKFTAREIESDKFRDNRLFLEISKYESMIAYQRNGNSVWSLETALPGEGIKTSIVCDLDVNHIHSNSDSVPDRSELISVFQSVFTSVPKEFIGKEYSAFFKNLKRSSPAADPPKFPE